LDNPHITLTFAVVLVSADDISYVSSNFVTGAPFAAAANDDEDERNDDSHWGFSKIALLFISFSVAIDDISTNSCAAVEDDATSVSAFDPAESGVLTVKMKGMMTIKIGSRDMKCDRKIIPRVKWLLAAACSFRRSLAFFSCSPGQLQSQFWVFQPFLKRFRGMLDTVDRFCLKYSPVCDLWLSVVIDMYSERCSIIQAVLQCPSDQFWPYDFINIKIRWFIQTKKSERTGWPYDFTHITTAV
jgi:hypothetical protein